MGLKEELGLSKSFATVGHEALLNIYFTATCIKKRATEFLRPFGLTDVQFNLMLLIKHQGGKAEGLSQSQLSEMMLVNRSNITSLIDRMEKGNLVVRTAKDFDRRFNVIKLTKQGKKVLEKVEPVYALKVKKVIGALTANEQKKLIMMLEKVRGSLG